MTRVFSNLTLSPAQESRLREGVGAGHLDLVPEDRVDGATQALFERCEVAFGNPPPAWIASSQALRWVQLESVGFGEYAALDWRRLGERVRMTNLATFFAEPVAESILAGILGLYRGLDRIVRLQERQAWQGDLLRPGLRVLRHANVVLFGHGAINARLAELLAPFECRVTAFRRGWTAAELDAALAEADIIVSTVPDTPGTRDVFDRRRLSHLKATALFVSFGRGSVVDDDALADMLQAGALGGAVIDVTREEPLPAEHRFWRAPSLILTQHSAGGTTDEIDRKIDTFLANLARYRRGEVLAGLVDFSRGY